MKKLWLVLLIFLTLPLTAQEEIERTRQGIKNARSRLSTSREALEAANRKEEAMAKKLAATRQKLEAARTILRDVKARLERAEVRLEKIRRKVLLTRIRLRRSQRVLENRLRQMYIEGEVSYLAVLLQSDDFTDFLNQAEFVERILETDHELIGEVRARKSELEIQKQAARRTVEEMKQLRREHEAKVAVWLQLKKEQNAVFAEYRAHRQKLAKQVRELEHSSQALENKLRRLLAAQNAPSYAIPGSAGRLIYPVSGPITSPFGYRFHPIRRTTRLHTGVDFGVASGTPIRAADNGVVIHSGWYGGYGYCVILNHGSGYSTLYAHCSSLYVSVGQTVSQGQSVAAVGSTGMSTGPHLHWELRRNGVPINPLSGI